jgi:hypothetical protein
MREFIEIRGNPVEVIYVINLVTLNRRRIMTFCASGSLN